ncbi:MAG: PHP domain-containing protein [Clostridia bacterium]|nr:PHP domain-containing protein [Clostridia bacterium]
MKKYFYDLHIHSCLSPCGDDEMNPGDIAGMAAVAGLNIAALTDHNTCLNCPAFFKAARARGIIPVAGMELTTAEDIHLVCLFDSLEGAMAFGEYVDSQRIKIKNRKDIFGNQIIIDEEDRPAGEEEYFLSNATAITLEQAPAAAEKYGGVCFPAHIDREANGIVAVLGTFPESPAFTCAEFRDGGNIEEYHKKYPALKDNIPIVSSDAHYLWLINDAANSIELDGETEDEIRKSLIRKLKNI